MKQLTRLDMKYKAFLEDAKVKPLEKEYEIKYVQTKEAPKIDKDIISEVKYDRVSKEFCYSKKIDTGNFDYEKSIKKYLKDNFSKESWGIVIPYYDGMLGLYWPREVVLKRDLITEKQVWIMELLLKHDLIKTQYKNVLKYLIKAYKILNNIPISLDPKY